ncbi:MAG TPA: hypothetical protein VF354_02955, partial [Candidatus Methanoperedens sp.]
MTLRNLYDLQYKVFLRPINSLNPMFLALKDRVDNLCDYTYNFTWQNNKILPGSIIPSQAGSNYTFSDLV